MTLNEAQERAVNHNTGPMLVLAGPGSGKTLVITERVKHLIEHCGVSPHKIAVITFTKAAAKEMKERFQKRMDELFLPVRFSTFHSLFFTILKQAYHYNASSILKDYQKKQILHEIKESLTIEIEDEGEFLSVVEEEISLVKNERIVLAHHYPVSCSQEIFAEIFQKYETALKRSRQLDFDDILVYCYELFTKRKDILNLWQQQFDYVLIDEFQDSATRFRFKYTKPDSENLYSDRPNERTPFKGPALKLRLAQTV